jgi:hypothetical protein
MSKNRALRRRTNFIKTKKRITRWWNLWGETPSIVRKLLNNHGKCSGLHTRREIGNAIEAIPYQEKKVREQLNDDLMNTENDIQSDEKANDVY